MSIPARVQTLTPPSGVSRWIYRHFVDASGTRAWATTFDGTIFETDLESFETRVRGRIQWTGPIAALPASELRPIWGVRGLLPWPPEQARCNVSTFLLRAPTGPLFIAQSVVAEPFEVARARATYSLHTLDGTLVRSLTDEPVALGVNLWNRLRVLEDHTAFSIARVASPDVRLYFDADGEPIEPDPDLVDALAPDTQLLRRALTRTLRARFDDNHVVFEDREGGEPVRVACELLPTDRPQSLSVLSPTLVLVRCWSCAVLVDLLRKTSTRIDPPFSLVDATPRSILAMRPVPQPSGVVSVYDLARIDRDSGERSTTTVAGDSVLALRGDTVVLLREGKYATLSRGAFSFDLRECAPMSDVRALRVSDRGAVCAQDCNAQIRWWNDDLSASCSSERWRPDAGARDTLLGWAEGQSTLIVRRVHANRTQIVGLAYAGSALVERWSFDTLPFDHCAFDEAATHFVTVANGRPSRLRWHTRARRERSPIEFSLRVGVRQLHLFGDRWLEGRANDQRMLFERVDDELVLRGASATHSAAPERVAIDWPGAIDVQSVELGAWTLRRSELDAPLFRQAPDGFEPRATASYRLDNKGPTIVETRRHLWIDADPLAENALTAVAFSPNGQWGAIATRLGQIQRFELGPPV
jgi:hypothetical protein